MDLLRRLRMPHRLAVLIAVFSTGFMFSGWWSVSSLNELKVNGPVYHQIVQGKDLIADVLPPPVYIIESNLVVHQLMDAKDASSRAALAERLKVLKSEFDGRIQHWSKAELDQATANMVLKDVQAPAAAFYRVAFDEFIPALEAADTVRAEAAMESLKAHFTRHLGAVNELVARTTQRLTEVETVAAGRSDSAGQVVLTVIAGSLALAFGAAMLISRSITAPLNNAVEATQISARGDFTATVQSTYSDEPGQLLAALHEMNQGLSQTMSQVRMSAETLNVSLRELASGNLDLSSRTESQASSLEETASAMEELTSTVKQNADNANQANQLVMTAAGYAVEGGDVVKRVVETMGEIKESSGKIVDIITVIDGIAFQTNILALNAAVEAARAGEQGRGFAVVASEVRNLAQRSAAAAKEIKTLIDDSVQKVEAGSKLVDEAGMTMSQIVDSVKQVTDIMTEIAAASQEQSIGIEEVNRAITLMDEATQQNAALVEEAAATAATMQDQSVLLLDAVSVFKLAGFVEERNTTRRPALSLVSSTPSRAHASSPHRTRSRPSAVTPAAPAAAGNSDWEEF